MDQAYALDYVQGDEISEFEYYSQKRKFKKERKQRRTEQDGLPPIYEITPMTYAQKQVFESYNQGYNLMLHGCAGTGKTFISAYLAIRDIMNKVEGKTKLQIIRSVVPTRDMGFLPGNTAEKSKAYEAPYIPIFADLFGRGDAYDILKKKTKVNFETTSFIRGMTFDDSIIIVDEAQNLTFHELDSVITRVGDNSRIIFCGDFAQSDFRYKNEQEGINNFMKIVGRMKSFDSIEFQRQDIVRSDLVKDYICTKLDLGM
jgi:phosphate starvation-inducible protein PhoH and related proteins